MSTAQPPGHACEIPACEWRHNQVIWSPLFRKWLCVDHLAARTDQELAARTDQELAASSEQIEQDAAPGEQEQWQDQLVRAASIVLDAEVSVSGYFGPDDLPAIYGEARLLSEPVDQAHPRDVHAAGGEPGMQADGWGLLYYLVGLSIIAPSVTLPITFPGI